MGDLFEGHLNKNEGVFFFKKKKIRSLPIGGKIKKTEHEDAMVRLEKWTCSFLVECFSFIICDKCLKFLYNCQGDPLFSYLGVEYFSSGSRSLGENQLNL